MDVQAAKQAAKGGSSTTGSTAASSAAGTPLSQSTNASSEDLTSSMARLKTAMDRSGSGVLTSDPQGRDIRIESYSLNYHGRLLIENADIALNYGQRCVRRVSVPVRYGLGHLSTTGDAHVYVH